MITTHRIQPTRGHIDWQESFIDPTAQVHLHSLRAEVEGSEVYAVFETDDERTLSGSTELSTFSISLLDEQELRDYRSDYPPSMMPDNVEVPVEVGGVRYTLVGILDED